MYLSAMAASGACSAAATFMRLSCHFRILLLLWFLFCVFVSIFCMNLFLSPSYSLPLYLPPRAPPNQICARSCARAALLDAWALCAARSPPRAPPSHFRARSCARVHLLDAWALCAARSLSELYLGHTGRAEPCSTRGRCAPRAPPRVHRPVSFVLGVVLRVLAKACGSVIAMVSVAEITSKRGRSGDHDLRRPEQVPLWRGKSTSERPPCGLTPAAKVRGGGLAAAKRRARWPW